MRYARHKDANHGTIVEAFRAAGASVEAIESGKAGLPDLLVGCFGLDQLVEVKPAVGETRRRELRDTQVAFARNWRGRPPVVVRTVDDALALVATMRGLLTRNEVYAELHNRHTDACLEVLTDPGATCVCRPPAVAEPMFTPNARKPR